MALGQRQVVDLLAEVSAHLVEPLVNQTLASPLTPSSPATITLTPSSPLPATSYLYPGAQVVVGWHTPNAEAVSVIAVTGNSTFTANIINSHSARETVFGATFPTQQPTDPVFTQSEIIDYIAQAQNSFLTKVPLVFSFLPYQEVLIGVPFNTLPNNVIELERVAVQSLPASSTFNISSISRTGGTVTATLSASANPDQWTPNLPILVQGVINSSFNSSNNLPFTLLTISTDGKTLTWAQAGANASSTGGTISRPIWSRLYESAQEQLAMANPQWFYQATGQAPSNWFEDRTGVYGWGVAPPPQGNFWMQLLASVRGSESLGLLDGFVVPDIFVYIIIYGAMEFAFSKDGVQRSPTMARYCKARFDFGVTLADRFLRNTIEKVGTATGNGF